MHIVIWGLGFRGKSLIEYLGEKYVCAVIDSDIRKIGTFYNGIEVISFDTYKKKYGRIPIIITPDYQFQQQISNELNTAGIYHYFYNSELPPNIRYNGSIKSDNYKLYFKEKDEVIFYGINAFSVLLYLFLHDSNKKVVFLYDGDLKTNQAEIVKLWRLKVISKNDLKTITDLYVTTHEYKENIATKFNNHRAIDMFRYADELYENRKIELIKFHNVYQNKRRCFIVATGPSLKIEDLEVLSNNNEFCFTVNSMCKKNLLIWKPNVLVISDGKFFSENKNYIRDYDCDLKFLPDDENGYWNSQKDGEYRIHRDSTDAYNILEFTEDITKTIGTQGTVTVGCIQIAVYMGFKEIYLLGTDCNYKRGSTQNHFGGDSKPDLIDHSVASMINAYKMCKKYSDSHGIKIYNATRGGMLEVFERVDFDSLFER